MGSLPSFAAQSTNGRNAKNRPFAALVANVSVADKADLGPFPTNGRFFFGVGAAKASIGAKRKFATGTCGAMYFGALGVLVSSPVFEYDLAVAHRNKVLTMRVLHTF